MVEVNEPSKKKLMPLTPNPLKLQIANPNQPQPQPETAGRKTQTLSTTWGCKPCLVGQVEYLGLSFPSVV